jgi:hypothetical protein
VSKTEVSSLRDRIAAEVLSGLQSGEVTHVDAVSAVSNVLAWTILLLGPEGRDEGLSTVIEILPKQMAMHLEQFQAASRRSAN